MRHVTTLSDNELQRALAGARNRRDAYSPGKEPASVLHHVSVLMVEQRRRSGEGCPQCGGRTIDHCRCEDTRDL